MEYRIGHRRGDADDADLAHALGAQRIDDVVSFLDEHHVDVGNVGIDRDVIFGVAVIHEAAQRVVGQGFLVQRHAYAPDHAADDLAARCFRVDDPAAGDCADHAGHGDSAEVLVHFNLDEYGRV